MLTQSTLERIQAAYAARCWTPRALAKSLHDGWFLWGWHYAAQPEDVDLSDEEIHEHIAQQFKQS